MRGNDLRRSWRRLRAAGAWAAFGDGMVTAALPLLAAETTHEPLAVAVVVAALHLPWAVAAVAGPVLTAGADRRTVIGGLHTLRTFAFGWLGVQALLGDVAIGAIAAVAFVAGAAVALVDDAEQETAAAVAPGRPAGQAGGRLVAPAVVSDGFLGIPAGAALFAVVPGAPFLVAAATYTVAALLALTVPHVAAAGHANLPVGRHHLATLARLVISPGLQPTATVVAGVSFSGSVVAGPLVLVALDELAIGASGVGVLLGVMAAGSLAGALLAPEAARRVEPGRALGAALVVAGAGYVAAGTVGEVLPAGAALAAGSLAAMAATVLAGMRRPPGELHARAVHALAWAAIPVGAVAGGALAGAWGLRVPLLAAGAALALLVPLVPAVARERVGGTQPAEMGSFAKIG